MTVLVWLLTTLGINLGTALGQTRVHFGNVMSLLAALLFGPVTGGIAAGLGSAVYDVFSSAWKSEFLITFLNKAVMGVVAGLVMHKWKGCRSQFRVWIAALCGSLSYCALYLGRYIVGGLVDTNLSNDVVFSEAMGALLPVTLANALIAVVCAGTLTLALKPLLKKLKVL